MNSENNNRNRTRVLSALACLLALAFLYAPLAAAFSPSLMACCTKGFCNIPKHHQKSKAAVNPDSVSTHEAEHEDCGHKMAANVTEMSDCSMDCCQAHETPAVSSVTFVMPPVFFVPLSIHMTPAVENPRAIEIPRAIEPASPPPRAISNTL